jgi:two-component system, OmpR family, sensor histidine kinase ChvG
MSLRAQLLAVALLTLVLPWAGWRYVVEMEGVLRVGLEQSLLASATTMAGSLAALPPFLASGGRASNGHVESQHEPFYAYPLTSAPRIDGYPTDWNLSDAHGRALGPRARYWAGVHERHLYVHIDVPDDAIVYQRAPTEAPFGDRVLLNLGGAAAPWLVINTAAPGVVFARATSAPQFAPGTRFEERILAAWVETAQGYAVELRLPLDLLGPEPRFGVGLVQVMPVPGGYEAELHTSWGDAGSAPGRLVRRTPELAAAAAQFAAPGRRLRIVDRQGWVLYDGGSLAPAGSATVAQRGFFENLLRLILSRDDAPYDGFENPPGYLADPELRSALARESSTRWYRRGADASAVVAAAAPVAGSGGVQGAVLLELGSDSILTLTNEALVRLLGFTLLASLIAAAGLLGYATLLSLRIRRLATAAGSALGPRGDIRAGMPGRRAGDEIGTLARSVDDMLKRLAGYTEYLRSLKGKLAHELRTPLAVVSTSLDNIEREPSAEHLAPYLQRIREGAARLDALINAMSEATAIEQAVTDSPRQRFDLAEVVRSCGHAYRDVYPDRQFALEIDAGPMHIDGSADLIAQMLDKLTDNAVSFSPAGSTITFTLHRERDEFVLRIGNDGPLLPEAMRAQLFDSLVSVRPAGGDGRRHLGLGLYIVALIVRFHGGRVDSANRADRSGVEFEAGFPVPPAS